MNKIAKTLFLFLVFYVLFSIHASASSGLGAGAEALAAMDAALKLFIVLFFIALIIWFIIHIKSRESKIYLVLVSFMDVILIFFSMILLSIFLSPDCGYGSLFWYALLGNFLKIPMILLTLTPFIIVLIVLNNWIISLPKAKKILIHMVVLTLIAMIILTLFEPTVTGATSKPWIAHERLETFYWEQAIKDNLSVCDKKQFKKFHSFDQIEYEEYIAKYINNEDIKISRAALNWIASETNYEVNDYLLAALNDERSEIRLAAIRKLQFSGDPRAVDILIEMLNNKDEALRRNVFDALIYKPWCKECGYDQVKWQEWWDKHKSSLYRDR